MSSGVDDMSGLIRAIDGVADEGATAIAPVQRLGAAATTSRVAKENQEWSDQFSAFQVTPTLDVLGSTPRKSFDQAKNCGVW